MDGPNADQKELEGLRDRTEVSDSHGHLHQQHGWLSAELGRDEADNHRATETS